MIRVSVIMLGLSQLEGILILCIISLPTALGVLFLLHLRASRRERMELRSKLNNAEGELEKLREETENKTEPLFADAASQNGDGHVRGTPSLGVSNDEPAEREVVISFPFTVGKSFLEYSAHPITILARHNPLLDKHVNRRDHPVTLHTRTQTLHAYIYHGDAGYGPYYQLKVPSGVRNTIKQDYHIGQGIEVELVLSECMSTVHLRDV